MYTPSEHRRRGYGAAVTAHATQAALDGGAAQVVLYTDLANPTSNAIYQSIGYIPDHNAEELRFVLGDVVARCTVTTSGVVGDLPEGGDAPDRVIARVGEP